MPNLIALHFEREGASKNQATVDSRDSHDDVFIYYLLGNLNLLIVVVDLVEASSHIHSHPSIEQVLYKRV